MPYFFIDAPLDPGAAETLLTGEDARHLAYALRARPGEAVTLCDPEGFLYDTVIDGFDRENVRLAVKGRRKSENEPPIAVTLYQALPKSDKLDEVVQKAVELGVSAVVPVVSERCVSRPDAGSAARTGSASS